MFAREQAQLFMLLERLCYTNVLKLFPLPGPFKHQAINIFKILFFCVKDD